MEVKVTIGTTPELTGLAVAVTNLINGQTSFSLGEAVKDVVVKAETAKEEAEKEKPKATRTRTAKKEEPGEQDAAEEKPAKEEKPKAEPKEDADDSITIEDIRKVQRKVSLGGGIEKMKDLLATFGVESASELDTKDYSAYYEKLVDLV